MYSIIKFIKKRFIGFRMEAIKHKEERKMKKYSWVAVVLLVFPLAFFGCGGNGGDDDDDDITDGEPQTVALGAFTLNLGATEKGWATNGTDNLTTSLNIADLKAAKYLVLEITTPPTGEMKFVWQSDSNNDWAWTEQVIFDDSGAPNAANGATLEDNVITIELSKAIVNYAKLATSTQAKIFIKYTNIDDLGITSSYLVIE
uniref:Glycoside hydrolase family 5 n=1 Tax=uncultured bacterium contig00026 TaxID=1181515 RepID=A0A806JY34_9BACT|nr:glycoside hydrolase family 5 [uncultured bacterium contig00026]